MSSVNLGDKDFTVEVRNVPPRSVDAAIVEDYASAGTGVESLQR